MFDTEPSYFSWVRNGSFALDTKAQFARFEEQFRMEKLSEKFNVR